MADEKTPNPAEGAGTPAGDQSWSTNPYSGGSGDNPYASGSSSDNPYASFGAASTGDDTPPSYSQSSYGQNDATPAAEQPEASSHGSTDAPSYSAPASGEESSTTPANTSAFGGEQATTPGVNDSAPLGDGGDQITDLSSPQQAAQPAAPQDAAAPNPYQQAPSGQTSAPYGQTSAPYGQTSAPGAQTSAPYGQQPVAAAPYGQTAAPGQPQPAYGQQPAAPQASPYAQPAYSAPYGTATTNQGGKFNVFGLIAVIAGGLGILLALIPFVGAVAALFGIVGIVLGVLGLTLKNFNAKKGLAIAGTIVSAVALIAGILNPIIWGSIVSSSTSSITSSYNSADYAATVELKVTGSGKPVDIDYKVSNGVSGENSFSTSDALFSESTPWEKSIDMKLNTTYDSSSLSLNVSNSDFDSNVTCEIIVNGKTVAKETSTYSVYCSVYGAYSYVSGSTP